jgi:hypothetical protein
MKTTKKAYEEYLNELGAPSDEAWIIGGTIRMYDKWKNQYGTALRKHDKIGFEVGYQEWKREIEFKEEQRLEDEAHEKFYRENL